MDPPATDPEELPRLARRLLRGIDRAALATLAAGEGTPYASFVLTACDHDGSPILLLSRLAEHTRNLLADGRVSLLLDGTAGHEDPLTGPRLTVVGQAAVTLEPAHRARFLARHPRAALYADFADFRFYRIAIARGHLVGGFGRIAWLDRADLVTDPAPEIVAAEADIVQHMNEDHADALDLYATALLGLEGGGWRMTGIDPLGCDLRRGGAVGRIEFAQPVTSPGEARAELVRLVGEARARRAT